MSATLRAIQHRLGLIACLAIVGFVSGGLASRFIQLPAAARMNTFPDDSFYYMVPALNIAKGLGATADTITRTSGYHPLWMAVLVGLARLCDCDKLAYFDVVIVAGMTLHAVTALLLYLAAVRFVPQLHAAAFSIIFLAIERGFLDALGGIEASLVTMLLATLLWLDASPSSSHGRLIARGICLGLLFLARTDSFIFIVAYFCGHAALIVFRQKKGIGYLVRVVGPMVASTALTCVPWLAISLWVYGSPFQGSQVAKQFWRARMLEQSSTSEALRFSLSMFRSWFAHIEALYPHRLLILLSFLGGITFMRLIEGRRPEQSPRAGAAGESLLNVGLIVIALVVYVIGAGLFYATQFVETRRWYFAGARVLWMVGGIALCAFAFEASSKTSRRVLHAVTGAVLVLIATSAVRGAVGYSFSDTAEARGPGQFVKMAQYINANLPGDAIIGAYSSGILSYFSERRVINLDGLANNEVVKVARSRTMDAYLDAKGVRYLADHESIVRRGFNVGLQIDGNPRYIKRLRELYRVPESSVFGDIVLWEVMPANADEGERS